MKWINRIRPMAACLLLVVVLGAWPVAAAAERTGLVTVKSKVENTVYSLYHIGSFSGNEIVLDKEYSSIRGLTTELIQNDPGRAAQLISSEIERRRVIENPISASKPPRAVVNGQVRFSGVERGIYLVKASEKTSSGVKYWSTSALVDVPQNSAGGENWNITMEAKAGSKTIDIVVYKRWSKDTSIVRPRSVRVQLMKDGEPYGIPAILRATGSAVTNWRHTWKNLDPDAVWEVVELDLDSAALKDYESTVEPIPNTFYFRITNTYQGVPRVITRLPKTGQLWWPVYAMASLGILLLVWGVIRRGKRDRNA